MQAIVPIYNADLFYYYLGLTNDGNYFIEAILPAYAAILIDDSGNQAVLPQDGIPFPGYPVEPSVWETYLQAVKDKLDTSDPGVFSPSLTVLDKLINSIQVTP